MRSRRGTARTVALAGMPLVTVDQVTHNQGNIVTVIDNYGYIGEYYDGRPFGEWPRRSRSTCS